MPLQVPPVDRSAALPPTSYGDTAGVEASSFWDTLGDVAKVAGPALLSIL
ncbi:hypothetical protein [Streptomyces sp. NPDC004267]